MKQIVPIYLVDAFADHPFTGNPAGVCYLMSPKPESWMQKVAAEMNMPETAFFTIREDHVELRWFTPKAEVNLCGHATLATAHVIWETELLSDSRPIIFRTRSGDLVARRHGDLIELDFPADLPGSALFSKELIRAIGVNPVFTGKGRDYYFAELENEQVLREIQPDLLALKNYPVGLCLTASASGKDYQIVSRFFAPAVGIDEDPVTGSAHCLLGPYWLAKSGLKEFSAFQASARGGKVFVVNKGERVLLRGRAVSMMQGVLTAGD